jgi:hypothetical protein
VLAAKEIHLFFPVDEQELSVIMKLARLQSPGRSKSMCLAEQGGLQGQLQKM